MLYKILSILVISFLFFGCSSKVSKYVKSTDTLHEEAMTQMQKTVIKDGAVTQVYIVATYLNQIKHELAGRNDEVERFIVNLYVPNEEKKEVYDEVLFVINGEEQACFEELKIDNELLKLIPAIRPWSKYYLVEAPRIFKNTNITFKFKTSNYESSTLIFHKDYL